jgi:multiple sugar transport system permease protein
VLLFTFVATWNNYFLPLVMLGEPRWYPVTVGLSQWNGKPTRAAAPRCWSRSRSPARSPPSCR